MTDLELLNMYCVYLGVGINELLSRKREMRLVKARASIVICLRDAGWKYQQIGRLLNRHHTSIMNLDYKFRNYLKDNKYKE
jgi:chromosomal replication initiation ATPase DnaA